MKQSLVEVGGIAVISQGQSGHMKADKMQRMCGGNHVG
jgi:hypothetical protein